MRLQVWELLFWVGWCGGSSATVPGPDRDTLIKYGLLDLPVPFGSCWPGPQPSGQETRAHDATCIKTRLNDPYTQAVSDEILNASKRQTPILDWIRVTATTKDRGLKMTGDEAAVVQQELFDRFNRWRFIEVCAREIQREAAADTTDESVIVAVTGWVIFDVVSPKSDLQTALASIESVSEYTIPKQWMTETKYLQNPVLRPPYSWQTRARADELTIVQRSIYPKITMYRLREEHVAADDATPLLSSLGFEFDMLERQKQKVVRSAAERGGIEQMPSSTRRKYQWMQVAMLERTYLSSRLELAANLRTKKEPDDLRSDATALIGTYPKDFNYQMQAATMLARIDHMIKQQQREGQGSDAATNDAGTTAAEDLQQARVGVVSTPQLRSLSAIIGDDVGGN